MVVGPTPPTRGVIAPATSSHALVDVGEQLAALVAHAAADHDRARRDVLGLEDAGHARGGDDDAGPLGVSGQSGTPVCTTVTAALAVGRFCDSSSASGRPSVVPRPRMHTS